MCLNLSYFILDHYNNEKKSARLKPSFFIKKRKNRNFIMRSYKIRQFAIGDILNFVYFYKNISLMFMGICIAIKKKSLACPHVGLILRNIIVNTGLELTISYFYNRAFNLKFLDYKRKFYTYKRNKLYFIRGRSKSHSRIN